MTGVRYVVDEKGKKKAVMIDIARNPKLWEDFCDFLLAREREEEPRETLASVKKRLQKMGKLR